MGSGGFGTVYLACQVSLIDMRAAVKILHPQSDPAVVRGLLSKFEGEARALAKLQHPNTVRLHDYGGTDTEPYLVMEFVDRARTLKAEIKQRREQGRPFELDEAHHILRQAANGLAAAHAIGIVHRDVKPENLMLANVEGDSNFVRILDFGLAKFLGDGSTQSLIMGTPAYMAPEQLEHGPIGPWTDVYALGAIAFELLLGQLAFPGPVAEIIQQKKPDARFDVLASLSNRPIPHHLAAFLRGALAHNPGARIPSAVAFLGAFELVVKDLRATCPATDRSIAAVPVEAVGDAPVEVAQLLWDESTVHLTEKTRPSRANRTLREAYPLADARRGGTRILDTGSQPLEPTGEVPPNRPASIPPAPVARPVPHSHRPAATEPLNHEVDEVAVHRRRRGLRIAATAVGALALLLPVVVIVAGAREPARVTSPIRGSVAAEAPTGAAPGVAPAPQVPLSLDVTSEPIGAAVRLNGRYVGTTPCPVRFDGPGPFDLTLLRKSFRAASRRFETRGDVERLGTTLRLELEIAL